MRSELKHVAFDITRYWQWVILAMGFSILCGVTVADTDWNPIKLLAIFLTIANAVILTLPFVWMWLKRENVIQPISIYCATAFGYVIGASFLLSGGQSRSLRYVLTDSNLPDFTYTLFVVLVGNLAYFIAYYAPRKTEQRFAQITKGAQLPHSASPQKLALSIVLITMLGFVGYYLFVQSSGGIVYLVQNINQRTLLRTTDYYRLIAQLMQGAVFIWFAYDLRAWKRPAFWLLFTGNLLALVTLGSAAPLALFIGFLFALNMSRAGSFHSFLGWWRQVRVPIFLILLVIVLAIGRIGWRESASIARRSVGTELTLGLIIERTLTYNYQQVASSLFGGANLASIESTSTIVQYVPSEIPYLRGQTFWWTVLTPIPRVLWPEKPTQTIGIYLKRLLENTAANTGGVPPSWLGELYINYGLFAVVLGNLLLGGLSRQVRFWFMAHYTNPMAQLLYIDYVLIFTFYLTKTEFKAALNRAAGFAIAFIIAYLILTRITPQSRTKNARIKQAYVHSSC